MSSTVTSTLGIVFVYWWAATGLTFAMQLTRMAMVLALVVTSIAALAGAWCIARSRNDPSTRGVRLAFLGSALVWWWCVSIFYAGWGIAIPDTVAPERSFALALQAIVATLRADALGVLAIVAIAAAVWRTPNRVALVSIAALWGSLQLAKLNVFFGVRNAGQDLLPEHLARLGLFFGPPHNSMLLPASVLASAALCAWLIWRASRAASPYLIQARAIAALLVALATLEYVLLGIDLRLPIWNMFLRTGS